MKESGEGINSTSVFHKKFYFCATLQSGDIAQSVEQRTENPCVGGSIPPLATNIFDEVLRCVAAHLRHGGSGPRIRRSESGPRAAR